MSIIDKIRAFFGLEAVKPEAERVEARGKEVASTSSSLAEQQTEPKESSEVLQKEALAPDEAGTPSNLKTTPEQDARIESEARALFDRGEGEEAISRLRNRVIVFNRHQPTTLPCLCKACLVPELRRCEGLGVKYVRDFVVARHHALFYWMPEELQDAAKQVRSSMRAELRAALKRPKRVRPSVIAAPPRQGINPFTNQVMTTRPRPPRVNPFTGKNVS